jgi:hypothetical protein
MAWRLRLERANLLNHPASRGAIRIGNPPALARPSRLCRLAKTPDDGHQGEAKTIDGTSCGTSFRKACTVTDNFGFEVTTICSSWRIAG